MATFTPRYVLLLKCSPLSRAEISKGFSLTFKLEGWTQINSFFHYFTKCNLAFWVLRIKKGVNPGRKNICRPVGSAWCPSYGVFREDKVYCKIDFNYEGWSPPIFCFKFHYDEPAISGSIIRTEIRPTEQKLRSRNRNWTNRTEITKLEPKLNQQNRN